MKRVMVLLIAGCAGTTPPATTTGSNTPPSPSPSPSTSPTTSTVAPTATSTSTVREQECGGRKLSWTLARATGMGSYITTLSCSEALFTVTSDRATPDGKETTSAFQVPHLEWEKAWHTVAGLRWQTLDDRCTEAERSKGRGEGPVYRITINDVYDKRSFTCAAMRELTAPLDALQSHLLSLAPPEAAVVATSLVGVRECDEYLDRYQTCVDTKVPAAQRHSFEEAIRFTREALYEAYMRKPDGATALANQCKEMHAAARAAMAQFKCKM